MFLRQVVVQGISVIGVIVVSRILSPRDFGLYALITFFVQLLNLIGDGGIASSLIQSKDEPSQMTIRKAFTLQQIFYISIVIISLPITFAFKHIYPVLNGHMWLLFITIGMFYMNSYRTFPSITLQRRLAYGKLSVVEMIEGIVLQGSTIILALLGFGVASFVISAACSVFTAVVLINVLAPVRVSFTRSVENSLHLLRFGLPIQMTSIVAFLRDSLTPTFLAMYLGVYAVGLVNFATRIAYYPTIPLNAVNRIMFPALARLQGDDERFSRQLNNIMHIYVTVLYGTLGLLAALLPNTISIVFGAKWLPAEGLIYSIIIVNLVGGFAWPSMDAFLAKGNSRINLYFTFGQFVMVWMLGVPLVHLLRLRGYEVLQIFSFISAFPLIFAARKRFGLRIWSNMWRPALSMGITFSILGLLSRTFPRSNWCNLIAEYLLGALMYGLVLIMLDGRIRHYMRKMIFFLSTN